MNHLLATALFCGLALACAPTKSATAQDARAATLGDAKLRAAPLLTRLPHRHFGNPAAPMSFRVVNGLSGEAINTAFVFAVGEPAIPVRGQTATLHHEPTDRAGFVALPQVDGAYWYLAEAPGFAARMALDRAWDDGIARMAPGIDVPLALRDYAGRPVPFATIGLCMGCGHTPDVRVARADAAGIAWLRGIDPVKTFDDGSTILDLYALAHAMDGDYDDFSWQAGEDPAQVLRPYATPMVGRILDEGGAPRAGLVVNQQTRHRGPAAYTDEKGFFDIMSPFGKRSFLVTQPGNPQPLFDGVMPPVAPMTYRLPRPDAAPTLRTLQVTVSDQKSGAPVADCKVNVGWEAIVAGSAHSSKVTDNRGRVDIEVPLGRTVLWGSRRPDDRAGSATRYDPFEVVFEVTADSTQDVAVQLQPQPTRKLRIHHRDDAPELTLATQYGEWRIDAGLGETLLETTVSFPNTTPAVLRFGRDADSVAVPLAPGSDPLDLYWPAPTQVVGRLVTADGAGCGGKILNDNHQVIATTDAEGRFTVELRDSGWSDLQVSPDDEGLVRRTFRVQVPAMADDLTVRRDAVVVAVGDVPVTTAEAAPLRFFNAAGRPMEERMVLLSRPGFARTESVARGVWTAAPPAAGDWVVVEPAETEGELWVRQRMQLEGVGPWALREHNTALQVTLVHANDQPLSGGHIYVADHYFAIDGDTITLRGLAPGEHELVVAHDQHGAGTVTVSVGETETAVRVALQGRDRD